MLAIVFFVAFWGRNAPGLGAQDAGLALGLSFLVPITLYGSLGLAAASAAAAFLAWRRGRGARLPLLALGIALLPVVFLAIVDPT